MSKQTSALEQRVCAALTDAIATSTLRSLIDEVVTGIGKAEQLAIAERERALDPTQSPNPHEARAAAEDAEFTCNRLRTILPRLQQRLAEQQHVEQTQKWRDRYSALQSERDTLSAELVETYPQLASQIADLFSRAEALNSRIKDLNVASPSGEPHLYSVELHARGLTGFSRNSPAILETCLLPAWETAGAMLWPPKRLPFAAQYGLGAAPDPHYGPDWWKAVAADNARKLAIAQQREAEEQKLQLQARQRYEDAISGRTPPEAA